MKAVGSLSFLLASITALVVSGCGSKPNPPAPQSLPKGSSSTRTVRDDPELSDAISKARSTLDTFIERLNHPQRGEVFSVEAAVKTPSGEPEYLWIGDVTYKDGTFSGTLTTQPKKVAAKYQAPLTAKRADVTDWMILKSGKSEGGYTVDVLLHREAQPN
jgi:uncharacterized protein YegJ (DUF2314 family)